MHVSEAGNVLTKGRTYQSRSCSRTPHMTTHPLLSGSEALLANQNVCALETCRWTQKHLLSELALFSRTNKGVCHPIVNLRRVRWEKERADTTQGMAPSGGQFWGWTPWLHRIPGVKPPLLLRLPPLGGTTKEREDGS